MSGNSGNARYKVRERLSVGMSDPRGIFGSGDGEVGVTMSGPVTPGAQLRAWAKGKSWL